MFYSKYILTFLYLFVVALFTYGGVAHAVLSSDDIVFGEGSITIDSETLITTVTQTSERMVIEVYEGFGTSSEETINIVQPSAESILLIQDLSGDVSEISADITAEGQLMLLNTEGIVIDTESVITSKVILISDLIPSEDELEAFYEGSGPFTLFDADTDAGGIVCKGGLRSSDGGTIILVGQSINVEGELMSANGDIVLTVGRIVDVALETELISNVTIVDPILSALPDQVDLITIVGSIISLNGNIYIDLYHSETIQAESLNSEGIINAVQITEGNGQVFLTDNTFQEESETGGSSGGSINLFCILLLAVSTVVRKRSLSKCIKI
ncbi:MAG: hypothetical protein JKY24_07525 [Pseudomonadales bacterium]|nr:hypothetical protein [Pseudomonadales bacterium]